MPTYNGQIVERRIEIAQDVVTTNNLLIPRDYYTGDEVAAINVPQSSFVQSFTQNVFEPHSRSFAGVPARDFGDDWYNRIHVIPAVLQLGTVTSDRDAPVNVWNAYLHPVQITDVDTIVSEGLVVQPPAGFSLPYTVPGLAITPFVMKVSTQGPSQIDATFNITVAGTPIAVRVTGVRSAAFYFALNWSQGALEESWEANSWVFRAASGAEQSGSASGSKAVKRELTFPVQLTKRHAQAFNNMVFAWQERAFGVPHRGESSHLTSAIAAGASFVPCDTAHRTFYTGGSIFIFDSNDRWETRSISNVLPDGIELTTPLTYEWDEDTRVCPLLPGFISDKVSASWLTSGVMRALVTFTLEPSGMPSNLTETPPAVAFNGVEVYTGKVNWREEMPVDFESSAIRMDKKVGKIRQRPIAGYSTITRRHTWLVRNREDARLLRDFVGRRRGIARRVYMPSGLDDFTLIRNELSGSSTLDVERNVFGELIGSHPARRRLFIELRDGTILIRTILSATELEGEVATRLNLNEAHGRDIEMSNVKRISFLHLYRFSSNRFTLRWLTDEKGEADADMTVLREDT